MIKCPITSAGSGLQAVEPLAGGIDGAPLNVTAAATVSTNTITSSAVYIYANVPLHFRLSAAGTPATVNDPPIPANIPFVFRCNIGDRISLIRMSTDGLCWVHELRTES